MTNEQTILARRAVACKGWRWMPGMMRLRVTSPGMGDHLKREGRVPDGGDTWEYENWPVIPDVTDAATVGCLLALVREAWNDPAYLWGGHAEVRRDSKTLFVVLRFGHDANGFLVERWVASGATEAEALVAALESAP